MSSLTVAIKILFTNIPVLFFPRPQWHCPSLPSPWPYDFLGSIKCEWKWHVTFEWKPLSTDVQISMSLPSYKWQDCKWWELHHHHEPEWGRQGAGFLLTWDGFVACVKMKLCWFKVSVILICLSLQQSAVHPNSLGWHQRPPVYQSTYPYPSRLSFHNT